ncbi:MAG: protein-glutamate O-methyltransferase CheR [Leptospiraceae bacterium]|nr:protein-glutamate O-methyltransferase CheR [Leptospiraceae bacterium]MCK6381418.1 protein-glutamate O-methyltransferase CheR [Leptospiraceae bacterium]NUM41631.1 protein-glutamate O-methyltransferase CheR [Leptospiraceae bacterium]
MEFPELTDREFKLFQKLIYEKAGISMSEAKKALISNRLAKRIRHFDLNTYLEYYKLIESNSYPEESQILVDLLTTNETYFFREQIHFDFLKNEILQNPYSLKNFRVWSAASSSGEEAYSIAMILSEKLGHTPWEIIGSDISIRILEKAKKGIYLLSKSTGIPKNYLKKYCLRGVNAQEGHLKIINEIKSKVHFYQINLNEPLPDIGKFNVVFLRNVMIYFDNDTRKKIIENILPTIEDKGYLFIGHSETLFGITDSLKNIKPTIYQKK